MAAPVTGQVALSGTAQPVSTPRTVVAFSIKAPLSNLKPAFLGPAGVTITTGYQLDPGDVFEYERKTQSGQPTYELSLGDLYAVGTGPDVVSWIASP